jgi:hypothetical protein
MVLLHALEHDHVPPQISQDGDAVADIRSAPAAISEMVAVLESGGFRVNGMSPDGIAHRFVLEAQPRDVVIDLLAPDGVGPRADLTTSRPGRTIQVPGGTQALQRTELVSVAHRDRIGKIPRPLLLAALVLKGAACGITSDDPARHLRDLALLCSLVEDPLGTRSDMTNGQDAYRILTDNPR